MRQDLLDAKIFFARKLEVVLHEKNSHPHQDLQPSRSITATTIAEEGP